MCNTNSRNNETEIGRKINMYYVKNEKSNGHSTLLSITFLLMYIIWWEMFTIKSIQYLRLFSCNLIVI